MSEQREERIHGGSKAKDQRKVFQIDRDRVLYSSALRRLAQVTQVVGAAEGNVFHNRLTHSLKVAQVARRVAEKLIEDSHKNWRAREYLDPDVVEAAALAHDLGHPPFGHIAEKELDLAAIDAGLEDGFEGNAQTFRILTWLEPHRDAYRGLNLTRATLDATLKYPWYRLTNAEAADDPRLLKRTRKFSAYKLDKDAFEFARQSESDGQQSDVPTLEAQVMEFADDVTYSVHDLEDFSLAGLIPLYPLAKSDSDFDSFIDEWRNKEKRPDIIAALSEPENVERFRGQLRFYVPARYSPGSIEQITHIRSVSSNLIQKFVQSISLKKESGSLKLVRNPARDLEMIFLQRLVYKYVIYNPRLATQQHGQREIIKTLFKIYIDAVKHEKVDLLPTRFLRNGSIEHLLGSNDTEHRQMRLAVDIVASMSEVEAVTMYRRLTGTEQGSVMDYI
jgi:dGTPase